MVGAIDLPSKSRTFPFYEILRIDFMSDSERFGFDFSASMLVIPVATIWVWKIPFVIPFVD